MRFSVLIPVYNVEKYLDQCLRSVISQNYTDFEVILVNDGSTDQSPAICRRFAEMDSRIKFFDKKNEGLLMTRRFSIKQASGEFFVFLDSDDYWDQGVLSKLNEVIEFSHSDMICYRYRVISDEGNPIYEDKGVFDDRTIFDKTNMDIFLKEFVSTSRLNNIWLKCVKSTIVDKDVDYSAFKDKKGEDILQSIALIRNATSILYLDDVLVNYRLSVSGRGRNFRIKYVDDYDIVKNHIFSNLLSMDVSDSIMNAFYIRYLESLIGFLGSMVTASDHYESFKGMCKHLENYRLYGISSKYVHLDKIDDTVRNDYVNLKKKRYFVIYCNYKIRNLIKQITSH